MENTLDVEELKKRIEWLDNERRNDKTIIATLQSRLESLNTENDALQIRLSDIEGDITRLSTMVARLEQYDLDIKSIRAEISRKIEDFKGKLDEKELQTGKNQNRIKDLHSNINDLEIKIQSIEEFNKTFEGYPQKDTFLQQQIEELKGKFKGIVEFHEDNKRSLQLVEENRRQDAKRVTDIKGEMAVIRKRQEENRSKQDLTSEDLRKLESRIKELFNAESERREEQTAFMEKVNLAQVDRDKAFKEWAVRFDTMERINKGLEKELSGLEATHLSVKKSQAELDEVTQRFERRVNEITEIQRLNEDRFRQEWTTYKSDDQKRWSNYTLAQTEQQRETHKSIENLSERLSNLVELIEDMKVSFEKMGEDDIKRMQVILSSIRESIDVYNTIFKD